MSLEVSRKKIDEVLQLLKEGNWQIPEFQRDYVWTQDQVKKLVTSILNSYPIGLITTWDQPQNNPHTPGEPLKLKGNAVYKNYSVNPAVIKLVLDGKQRLTTLAMVFGGFKANGGQYAFSGEWFIDLDALLNNKDLGIVLYKKQSEIQSKSLNVITTCIRHLLIPLKDFHRLSDYIAKIHDPATYPNAEYPPQAEREKRVESLKGLQKTYESFLIPFAEIPNTISLGNVCEIFDVLNTTGTKVSTFDLLHNMLFKDSSGSFNLREKFNECANLQSIGLLCDEGRQEFFCQVITGCNCIMSAPGRNGIKISSIKGPDLINTTLAFYNQVCANLSQLDEFASNFFENVLRFEVSLSELPYPASAVIYFSLRWKMFSEAASYSREELEAVFRAFYWRNVLSNRYDQGFLTQFSVDLKKLDQILESKHPLYNGPNWVKEVNKDLNDLFGNDYPISDVNELKAELLSEDTRGALRQLYLIQLKSVTHRDIVDNSNLDWDSVVKGDRVQIHHIFPQDWCKNNAAAHLAISDYGVNCLANLTPLKAGTNNKWRANGPKTAIANLEITFQNNSAALSGAYIDSVSFALLAQDKVGEFWERRADAIANDVYNAQFVC